MARFVTVAKWKDDKTGFFPIDPNTNQFVTQNFKNLLFTTDINAVADDPTVSKLTYTTDPFHPDKNASVPCCIEYT